MATGIVSHPNMTQAWNFYQAHRIMGKDKHRLVLQEVGEKTIDMWFEGEYRYTYAAMDGETMVGLVSGVYLPENKTGYLSYLAVDPAYTRQGIGTMLMGALEKSFANVPDCEKIDIVFRNPVHLPWYVRDDGGHHHPCVPGVDVASNLYVFLKNRGYRDFAMQNAYYRPLADYQDPPDMAKKREKLLSEGVELTLYDPVQHFGLAELFDNINNQGWKHQVMASIHLPIVVAVDHNTTQDGKALVVAYTGPLTQYEGRGVFCGIGTHTAYRGRGIGKLVFCEMCYRHREGGATFMSLYTGENNPARNIYEAAGFRIVRSFANMRKMLVR